MDGAGEYDPQLDAGLQYKLVGGTEIEDVLVNSLLVV